jgi:hypothetical protein
MPPVDTAQSWLERADSARERSRRARSPLTRLFWRFRAAMLAREARLRDPSLRNGGRV